MKRDLSHIEFYFPEGDFLNKNKLVERSIDLIVGNESINYSGYANKNLLREGILSHIGDGDIDKYRTPSFEEKNEIQQVISKTIKKCNRYLTVPTKNFVFVHPYFPNEMEKVFNGVMAVAVYSAVFHIFIDLNSYTKEELENIVAHELNHTIYYYHHYDNFNNYTLLDNVLMEGLAENFREKYFNPMITPWAGALEKKEALSIANYSKNLFDSQNEKLINEFLFGNNEYKKWTGYSVGYWIVREYIQRNPDLHWNDLMKISPNSFLTVL